MRLLIVEDSDSDARLLEGMIPDDLRPQIDIRRARTLREAVELARTADMIVVDEGLPDAMGPEAPVAMQELASLAEVMLWTGHYNPQDVDAFASAGGGGQVLIKGGRPNQGQAALRGALQRAIRTRQRRDELAADIERILRR
jgi:DNA-binding NtrC family response regulator